MQHELIAMQKEIERRKAGLALHTGDLPDREREPRVIDPAKEGVGMDTVHKARAAAKAAGFLSERGLVQVTTEDLVNLDKIREANEKSTR